MNKTVAVFLLVVVLALAITFAANRFLRDMWSGRGEAGVEALIDGVSQQMREEAIAADLEELGFAVEDAVRSGDFTSLPPRLTPEVSARLLPAPALPSPVSLPVFRGGEDPAELGTVRGPAEVVAALAAHRAGWSRIYDARFKLKRLEKDDDDPDLRIVAFAWEVRGESAAGVPLQERARFRGVVRAAGDRWLIQSLEATRHELIAAPKRPFTQVTRAAGLETFSPEHLDAVGPFIDTSEGPHVATNLDYGGLACADANGDGHLDLYVCAAQGGNYLFLNRGDGRFVEAARRAGVATTGGSRGAVFGDVDADGDQDLFVTKASFHHPGVTRGGNQLFLNDGRGRFTEATRAAGLEHSGECFSSTFLDFDADGDLDLYVCGYGHLGLRPYENYFAARNGEANRLYRNDGTGRFVEIGKQAGVADEGWSYAVSAGDYDDDGDPDLYVANDYGPNRLYRNEGDGTFVAVEAEAGVANPGNGMGAAWADVDGDGLLDLYTTNMSSSTGQRIIETLLPATFGLRDDLLEFTRGNAFFRAAETGRFVAEGERRGIAHTGWAWHADFLDFDRDGDEDLYVANGYVTGATRKDY